MFNKDFFPTPTQVLDQMGIGCYGKVVLEPSAGKGDIVDYLKSNGAEKILACEINDDLRKIVSNKCDIIGNDFLNITSESISHVQLIVMNPPFSADEKHIIHAWEVAPEGCEIIALCNWETIANKYTRRRDELGQLIDNYGEQLNLGDCFTTAERKTGVEIGLVKLFKPVTSENIDWDGFYYTDTDVSANDTGIMPYNDIRAIVNTYVGAIKCFDKAKEVAAELNGLTGLNVASFSMGYQKEVITKEQFAREFQIKSWKRVFDKIGIEKYVTRGVLEDVNKFINARQNYPFTMKNIYRMLEIIVGTREQTMNKAIVEAVDNFTKHTHENRFGVEGWKTNEGHLLNEKFICGYISRPKYSRGLELNTYNNRNTDQIIDLIKALCFVTGSDFNKIPTVYDINKNELTANTWYDWGFFEFKIFKKGTGHFKFKDKKVWEQLNRAYAKIKGQVLPEKI